MMIASDADQKTPQSNKSHSFVEYRLTQPAHVLHDGIRRTPSASELRKRSLHPFRIANLVFLNSLNRAGFGGGSNIGFAVFFQPAAVSTFNQASRSPAAVEKRS